MPKANEGWEVIDGATVIYPKLMIVGKVCDLFHADVSSSRLYKI